MSNENTQSPQDFLDEVENARLKLGLGKNIVNSGEQTNKVLLKIAEELNSIGHRIRVLGWNLKDALKEDN